MQRFKSFALGLLGLALLLAIIGGAGWLIYQFFQYISAVPKELGAALVAAATTILVATATVMIGRYYERRKELDALYRDKKTEIYDEFLKEFFGLFFGAGEVNAEAAEKDLVPFLREFTRKLILWSGPEVIEAFVAWKDHLGKGVPDAQTIFLTGLDPFPRTQKGSWVQNRAQLGSCSIVTEAGLSPGAKHPVGNPSATA